MPPPLRGPRPPTGNPESATGMGPYPGSGEVDHEVMVELFHIIEYMARHISEVGGKKNNTPRSGQGLEIIL